MCSPVSDGSAALLVASRAGLERLGISSQVQVLSTVLRSGTRLEPGGAGGAVADAARAAYEQAGVGPEDLNVVEVHDAAAPGELILYEDIGIAEPGRGAELLRSGATELGGRVPVNPGGGLLSRGHPVGATGCAQLVELTDQLRGRCGERQVQDARLALAENGGGWIGGEVAAVVISVLASR
jgi:acetyl-CoA acetyltransferase